MIEYCIPEPLVHKLWKRYHFGGWKFTGQTFEKCHFFNMLDTCWRRIEDNLDSIDSNVVIFLIWSLRSPVSAGFSFISFGWILKELCSVQGSMVIDNFRFSSKVWRLRLKTPQNLCISFLFPYYSMTEYFIPVYVVLISFCLNKFQGSCVQYKVVWSLMILDSHRESGGSDSRLLKFCAFVFDLHIFPW